ncbi:hypothetical protein [Leptospira adleri]|uniref:hypothetical protein n=1 Tax=Leptospira adleri TaxID=2023186 RepID=UPI0010836A13|nr:hypothetical protein [Leptospira adleri]TGM52814.1 hypothetical protein EHQ97_12900 [Leptospira adleri]
MGKTQSIELGKGMRGLRFLIPFLFLYSAIRAESGSAENSSGDLSPFFFSAKPDSSLVFGILSESKKENLPSYGAKLSVPFFRKNSKHLWKINFLYENERIPARENRAFHRTFSGLEYSYLSFEDRFCISWFAGWERGEIDLFVFGTRLEFSGKQEIQFFGKRGGDFENVSILLHSPLEKELKLFLGVSRTWNETRTEDRFFLGIGFYWDRFQASVSGEGTESKEHSISGIFEFQNISDPVGNEEKPAPESKKNFERKKHPPFAVFSLSPEELLSAGFSLNSALKISRESFRAREEFFEFIDSLSEKDKNKVFLLLRKKNPTSKTLKKGNS